MGALKSFLVSLALGLLEKIWAAVKEWLEKRERAKRQEESKQKLEDDVQSQKPRDEETRKNEADWLNS